MSDQIRKMDEALEAPRSRRQLFKLAGAAGVGDPVGGPTAGDMAGNVTMPDAAD